jgi:NAD(P)-dependent dehydrogenase (short-subunit alcohol dehydrogenase family)
MATSSRGRLAGKVAIITGGASGIGLATARRFVAEGASVMIGDLAEDQLATATSSIGTAAAGLRCDVRVEDDVEALAAAAVERFGRLDIAFANAGGGGSFAPITDTDPEAWIGVFHVNTLGPMLTVKHAARRMEDGGSIVITASLNAVQPAASMSAYCCSKAAAMALAEVAALELGPAGIRVNAIGPGLVRTNLSERMFSSPEIVAEFDENAPLATTTSADDVASLVTFLGSDDSTSITGCFHLVDRGAHMMRYPDLAGHRAKR